MSQDYARALARITVAQIAEATGFQAVQQSAGDALAELLLQYVSEIGSATHAYAELAGRTDCNVNDVVSSNSHKQPNLYMGVNVMGIKAPSFASCSCWHFRIWAFLSRSSWITLTAW